MKTSALDIILIAFLAAAVIADHRRRRIPNYFTMPVIGIGLVLNVFLYGYPGFRYAAAGAAIGAGLFLVPYIFGGIGGGDLKMLAAVGALKGAAFVFSAFLSAAVVGGVIALVITIFHGTQKETWHRIKTIISLLLHRINPSGLYQESRDGSGAFPYAGAIAAGAVGVLVFTRFFTL